MLKIAHHISSLPKSGWTAAGQVTRCGLRTGKCPFSVTGPLAWSQRTFMFLNIVVTWGGNRYEQHGGLSDNLKSVDFTVTTATMISPLIKDTSLWQAEFL